MKNRWKKIVCIMLALIMLSLGVTACNIFGGSGGNGGTEVPVVEINRVAPNNLDLAGMTEVALATPGEGAILVNEAARIWVPPGAVANDTPVTIKTFIESPESLTSTVADAPEVTVISNFYDLGPDNTEFSQPVTVTLSYAEEDLPAGADENNIVPIYYNGVNWITMERQLDTENNRVSFETTSFPGLPIVLVLGYAVTGTAITASVGAVAYKTYSWWVKDPVYYGKAAEYVTPDDPTVQKYADMSTIKLIGSDTRFDIKDLQNNPNAIAALENNVDADGYVGFIKFFDDSGVEKPMDYHVSWNPNDWQKPGDFFNNGMVGDCKNVANAVGSIVRYYGFPAKCMDGYTNGARHAWLEVKIGEKMYYVGSRGELMTLEGATKFLQLTRSVNKNGETFQWDEGGQKPYKKNWWVDKIEVTVDKTLAFPGGKVGVEISGAAGTALDIQMIVEAPDKTTTPYTGTTDAKTGKLKLEVQIKKDAVPGVYFARASVAESNASEIGIFSVEILEIAAGMVAAQVAPGEDIGINVRLTYPLFTKITIDGVSNSWMTEPDGSTTIPLKVPVNAKLQTYTLTVRAPDYEISTTVKYTVTVPSTLKVQITNKEVAPGGNLNVNITVMPPQVTKITVRGYQGQWSTNTDGVVAIKLSVPATAKPGQYTVTAEAPALKLIESDTYTVTTTLGPLIGLADVTAIAAQVTINAEGEDEESEWEMQLLMGGQFVRTSGVKGYEIFASGTVDAGEMYYSFTLNKELTTVTSGVISLVADTGEYYEVRFSNVPMDADYENTYYESEGVNALIFRVKGTEVSSHLGSIKVNEPSLGTFNRFFAVADSEIIIVLAAATDAQMTELLDE